MNLRSTQQDLKESGDLRLVFRRCPIFARFLSWLDHILFNSVVLSVLISGDRMTIDTVIVLTGTAHGIKSIENFTGRVEGKTWKSPRETLQENLGRIVAGKCISRGHCGNFMSTRAIVMENGNLVHLGKIPIRASITPVPYGRPWRHVCLLKVGVGVPLVVSGRIISRLFVDRTVLFPHSTVLAHRQAVTVADNQNHSENRSHKTHMSMSRTGAVEVG
ncbi:hypothetical protein Tco_0047179 [Tanacetum coccineum]